MSKAVKDKELKAYQKRIGSKEYRYLYIYELNKVRRLTKSNTRHSRKVYVNSEEKLKAIKAKYKNGVTKEILIEWLGGEHV